MSKSTYTIEKAKDICELLSQGQSLVSIAKRSDMPNRVTIHEWIEKYKEFGDMYARAREDQADYYAESIVDIASETEVVAKYNGETVTLALDSVAVQRNRLRVDAQKWIASKMNSRKYGDKTTLSGDSDAPLAITVIERAIVKPKELAS